MKYKHAALGGTFDHLHLGHKFIIDFTLNHADKVSIGISTPKLYQGKILQQTIEHFDYRKQTVEVYLKSKRVFDRVSIFPLDDIFGTTLSDESLDSIVVTDETEPNAKIVNTQRVKKGLNELAILKCTLVKGPDEKIISSTCIRRGSINRAGFPYSSLFSQYILYLPQYLRQELQKPLETPIFVKDELNTAKAALEKTKENRVLTIGVGDIVNNTLLELEFVPDLQIIDYKTRRKAIENKLTGKLTKKFKNDPGTLNKTAVSQVHSSIQEILKDKVKRILVIDGEEDLLTLPAILLSPLHSVVFYGQWDAGIVLVEVTEEIKEKISAFVKQFSKDELG